MPVKLSIITPSYNQAVYLDETICSVLSQRDQVHEYFVLDGGSTDGSVDIIKKYADKIDYWTSTKDKGQSDAIHKGFHRATGDYLCWINSDDVFLPNALRTVRQALECHPEWDVVTGYHIRIDADSRIIRTCRVPGESLAMARRGVYHVAQQTCFFRRDLYERVGGLDLNLHISMDVELWFRMFDANAVWGHIPEYLAAFRIHGEAKGTTWQDKWQSEAASLREKYPQYHPQGLTRIAGLWGYRLGEVLSGRRPRALWESWRLNGRPMSDVFSNCRGAAC